MVLGHPGLINREPGHSLKSSLHLLYPPSGFQNRQQHLLTLDTLLHDYISELILFFFELLSGGAFYEFWRWPIMDRVNHEQDEDQQAFLPKARQDIPFIETGSQKPGSPFKKYLRLGLEIVMAVVIVVLLIRPFPEKATTKSSPVPKCRFPTSGPTNNVL